MTPEQRNDLCIEWEYTNPAVRQKMIEEFQERHRQGQSWENWEEFIVEKLNIRQFWQTVGLM